MDDETVDVFEIAFAADAEPPAAETTATEAAAPEVDAPPEAEPTETVAEIVADAPAPEEPEAVEATPDPGPPPVDWNHPELVRLRAQAEQDRAEAEQSRQMKAQLALLAQQRQAAQFQAKIAEQFGDDQVPEVNRLMAQVAAPAVQQAQAAISESERWQKTLAAYDIAVKNHIPEAQLAQIMEDVGDLMAVEGVEVMQNRITSKRAATDHFKTQLAERDRQIRDLQLQVAARAEVQARAASGADLVDGGGGGVPPDTTTRMQQAESFDDYWSAMTGRA
jgi:hypothetical protein